MPICRDCSGKGSRFYDGPAREICHTCKGSGQRLAKAIDPLGPRKRSKMLQVAEHKMNYVALIDEAGGPLYYVGDPAVPSVPCQTCQDSVPINESDFSHKKAAGMGGAGDKGGLVEASNGTYSCRCCHDFIEKNMDARAEHQLSPATIENCLKVEFSPAVRARWEAWRRHWFNLPEVTL